MIKKILMTGGMLLALGAAKLIGGAIGQAGAKKVTSSIGTNNYYNKQAKIRKAMDEGFKLVNKQFPKQLSENERADKVAVDHNDKDIIYYYTISNGHYDGIAVEDAKAFLFNQLKGNKKIIDLPKKAGYSMTYFYSDEDGETIFSFTFDNDDLKEM